MKKTKILRALVLGLMLAAALLSGAASGETGGETGLERFIVNHGSRSSPKIAITMDDIFEREWAWKTAELCRKHGIRITYFPIGANLFEKDTDEWRRLVADGFEIGSHSQWHEGFHDLESSVAMGRLGHFQEQLDRVLGYHYQVRWFRPPFGNLADKNGSYEAMRRVLLRFGYEHSLLWDVSQTDPNEAFPRVKNGSILLFHARRKDYECLEILIPRLLEAGFEPVTVSQLFGYPDPEITEECFVYDYKNYR